MTEEEIIEKGRVGEEIVLKLLERLPKDDYRVIHDIILRREEGSFYKDTNPFVQIDIVVVSRFGIFVLEVKNYDHFAGGGEHRWKWHHYTKNREHSFFPNPIHQNYSHTMALRKFLKNEQYGDLFPAVVFVGDVQLGITYVKSDVLKSGQLLGFIAKKSETKIISREQMDRICDILEREKANNEGFREAHLINAQKDREEAENRVRNHICPVCGDDLVLGHSEKGDYYRCSNTGNCKFRMTVEDE